MKPVDERETSAPPTRKHRKRKRSNLSQHTRTSRQVKLRRKAEAPEKRLERNRKQSENLRIRRAAENAEERASRLRQGALRRAQLYDAKRKREKRLKMEAILAAIDRRQNNCSKSRNFVEFEEPVSDPLKRESDRDGLFANSLCHVIIKEEFTNETHDHEQVFDSMYAGEP